MIFKAMFFFIMVMVALYVATINTDKNRHGGH